MSEVDTTTLDALVARLERAAEQLRTGDLSADAAAQRSASLAFSNIEKRHGAI